LQGTAKTSGQLKEGDLLIKVDGVRVSDANEAQQLLQVI
jgi:type II secretory pathway component PulC